MGSLLLAEEKIDEAKDSFEKALAIDSALGDAWLGHGLCLLRMGSGEAGWRDLQTAAALEPNRAVFRRYLGENVSHDNKKTTQKSQTARSTITPSPQPRPSPKVYRGQVVQDPGQSYPQSSYLPYSQLPPRPMRPDRHLAGELPRRNRTRRRLDCAPRGTGRRAAAGPRAV